MLDTLTKLLEKFIKLGEVREANQQRYVDRYVTPLYSVAEAIYKDYSSTLRELRRKVKTGRKTMPLIQFLEQRRLEQLPARMKIRAVLRTIPKRNWTRFEQGVLGLIHGCLSDFDRHQSIYPIGHGDHTLYDMIRYIESRGEPELAPDRGRLLSAIERQIQGIDKAWEFVCVGYADLQRITVPDITVPKSYVYERSGD
ncbi:hypothetical protein [Pedosphaera parvula]|uniref:Uncharacterized protein n=1 Tax=Pedosphaera parvula (strain Ellin514) TaxID=320771 RepID=B9XAU6_PEDPL|nr:hypothetical protein [Pedosphaera parvula]EEF63131.1 hypothetical protein Cflav_PD5766 [Pedosphaera parvula Ellin514]